jgi:hypothetical protein
LYLNTSSFSIQDENPKGRGFSFTFSDFKLRKEGSLTLNKSGTKERICTIRDN